MKELHLADVNEELLNKIFDSLQASTAVRFQRHLMFVRIRCNASVALTTGFLQLKSSFCLTKVRTEKWICRQLETWCMPSVGKNDYAKQKGPKNY